MVNTEIVRNRGKRPLIIAYGVGTDSTALLVGLYFQGIRPDLILTADTGAEKRKTYKYLPIMQEWLAKVGFPEITMVKYVPPRAPYRTLEEEVLYLGNMPSVSYGKHTCSIKWKIVPQDRYTEKWQPAIDCWAAGQKVIKAIGYDAGAADGKRCMNVARYAPEDEGRYDLWFPLREWGWDRDTCKLRIAMAGLPQPGKSACKFCASTHREELDLLAAEEPDTLMEALRVEDNAKASGKTKKFVGLSRGWNWRQYCEDNKLIRKGKRLPLPVLNNTGKECAA